MPNQQTPPELLAVVSGDADACLIPSASLAWTQGFRTRGLHRFTYSPLRNPRSCTTPVFFKGLGFPFMEREVCIYIYMSVYIHTHMRVCVYVLDTNTYIHIYAYRVSEAPAQSWLLVRWCPAPPDRCPPHPSTLRQGSSLGS